MRFTSIDVEIYEEGFASDFFKDPNGKRANLIDRQIKLSRWKTNSKCLKSDKKGKKHS